MEESNNNNPDFDTLFVMFKQGSKEDVTHAKKEIERQRWSGNRLPKNAEFAHALIDIALQTKDTWRRQAIVSAVSFMVWNMPTTFAEELYTFFYTCLSDKNGNVRNAAVHGLETWTISLRIDTDGVMREKDKDVVAQHRALLARAVQDLRALAEQHKPKKEKQNNRGKLPAVDTLKPCIFKSALMALYAVTERFGHTIDILHDMGVDSSLGRERFSYYEDDDACECDACDKLDETLSQMADVYDHAVDELRDVMTLFDIHKQASLKDILSWIQETDNAPNKIDEAMQRVLSLLEKAAIPMENAQLVLNKFVAVWNAMPREELGGLSPHVARLQMDSEQQSYAQQEEQAIKKDSATLPNMATARDMATYAQNLCIATATLLHVDIVDWLDKNERNLVGSRDESEQTFMQLMSYVSERIPDDFEMKSENPMDVFCSLVRAFQIYVNHVVFDTQHVWTRFLQSVRMEKYMRNSKKPDDYDTMLSLCLVAHQSIDAFAKQRNVVMRDERDAMKERLKDIPVYEDFLSPDEYMQDVDPRLINTAHHILDWYMMSEPAHAYKKTAQQIAAVCIFLTTQFQETLGTMPPYQWIVAQDLAEFGGWKSVGSFTQIVRRVQLYVEEAVHDIDLLVFAPEYGKQNRKHK